MSKESKNIFALEEKIIVLSFVKSAAFLLGHPVFTADEQGRKIFQLSHKLETSQAQIFVSLVQKFLNKSQVHMKISNFSLELSKFLEMSLLWFSENL